MIDALIRPLIEHLVKCAIFLGQAKEHHDTVSVKIYQREVRRARHALLAQIEGAHK